MEFKSSWLFLLCTYAFVCEIYAVAESSKECFKLNLLDSKGSQVNCILLNENDLKTITMYECSCPPDGYTNSYSIKISYDSDNNDFAKIHSFEDYWRGIGKRNRFKLVIKNVLDSESSSCFVYLHEENIATEEDVLTRFEHGDSFTCQVLENDQGGLSKSEVMNINFKRRKRDASNIGSDAVQKTTKDPLTSQSSSTVNYVSHRDTTTRNKKSSVLFSSTAGMTTESVQHQTRKVLTSDASTKASTLPRSSTYTTTNTENKITETTEKSSSNIADDKTTSTKKITKPYHGNGLDLTTEIPNKISTPFKNTVKLTPTASTNQRKKTTSPGIVVVAVLVPLLIIIIIVIIAYKCYRRRYPVRMVIGKNFNKFANPRYTKKTSSVTLVASSFDEAPVSGGHDNPSLDVGYMELQPTNLSTNIEDSHSYTDVNEVPVKMPRRKKRVSVMSTESVDGRVMSAFLQEAMDEVDSESETVDQSTKKKITVDSGLLKNLSRVSTDSGNLNETDDTHYKNNDTGKTEDGKPADDAESTHEQSDIGNAETIDEVFQENSYEVMNYEEPTKREKIDESDREGPNEYDIVNVGSEDIQEENDTLIVQPFDNDSKEITEECNNEIPFTGTDSSKLQTDFVNIPDQEIEEDIAVDDDKTSPFVQPNGVNAEYVVILNSKLDVDNIVEVRINENSVQKVDQVNEIYDEYDATDEESSGSGDSYSFEHDGGSLKEPGSGDSSSSDSDEVSTANIRDSEINILSNKFTTGEQFSVSFMSADGKERDTDMRNKNGREIFNIEELNTTSDEVNRTNIKPQSSEKQFNVGNNESTMMDSQKLSKSEDSFTWISSADNTTNNQELFQAIQSKDDLEHIEITETANIIPNYPDGNITDVMQIIEDDLSTMGNELNSKESTNDDNPTNTKKTVAYVTGGSDISTDSSDERPGTPPPLPQSMPPIPVNFENTVLSESFAIVNATNERPGTPPPLPQSIPPIPVNFESFAIVHATNDVEESFIRPTAIVDSMLLNTDSSHDAAEKDTRINFGESTSTPPLPSSPPPSFEYIPSQSSSESFDMLTSQTHFNLEHDHETTGTAYNLDTNDEYDMVLNDDDLMPVSPNLDDHNDAKDLNTTAVKSNLNTSKHLLDEESGRMSDISSITDTSDGDSSGTETKYKPAKIISTNTQSQSVVSNVASSKVIASPKISFDDTDSSDGSNT